MAEICPLYGVVIRDAMRSGDKELMSNLLRVSQHLLGASAKYGSGCVDDWKTAHGELEKAVG